MSTCTVTGGRPLQGRIRAPGDKSISHRSLIMGALAEGTSQVTGLTDGEDVARSAATLSQLGAAIELASKGRFVSATILGGRSRLHEAESALDFGNSGTGMRLIAGVCASFGWTTTMTGDESLRRRPMDRIAQPLRQMGARMDGVGPGECPPLVVQGGSLHGIDYPLPVPSSQVKGSILLAGLGAEGETVVRESVVTRAHTEEMLAALGADVEVSVDRLTTRVRPGKLDPFQLDVPGDPSQAAYWIVAACITPGSDVVVERVYAGQARAGFLAVLERMGAQIEVTDNGDGTVDVRARYGPMHGTHVGGAEVAGLIDEILVLAVAAVVAEGPTTFADAAELRVKETDRVATLVSELGALGATVEARPDGLVVAGNERLRGGSVRSHGDHRVAMAMAIAGLASSGDEPVRVDEWEAVATSYPGFDEDLAHLCR